MKRTVLITRSQPGANSMAAAMTEAGYLPKISSLIRIEPVPAFVSRQKLGTYSAFIFVSAAAARHSPEIKACLIGLEAPVIYAIGPETQRQLLQSGLKSICPGSADSEGLLALPGLGDVNGKHILVICGRGGRETLQQVLQDRGAGVDRAEVYQRLPAHLELQNTSDLDAVIISSVEGLRYFLELAPDLPDRVPLLLPSQRVAVQARNEGVKNIIVCQGASSEAVLNKLDALFSSA